MTKMTPVKGTGRNAGIPGGVDIGGEAILPRLPPPVPVLEDPPAVSTILPARHQVPLPLERIILRDPPGTEAIEMDVVIVGAGPAGLACAIELARLVKRDQEAGGGMPDVGIAMLELFPDRAPSDFPFRQPVADEAVYFMTEGRSQRLPTPPTMHNAGYYTASLCEIVRWLGERAEEAGVNLFTGFPVDALLTEGSVVRGVRTS